MKTLITLSLVLFTTVLFAQRSETTYFDNGEFQTQLYLSKSKVVLSTYYPNGQLKEMGQILNGERDGIWKLYDNEGNLLSQGNFVNGKKEGTWKVQAFVNTESYNLEYKNGIRVEAVAVQ